MDVYKGVIQTQKMATSRAGLTTDILDTLLLMEPSPAQKKNLDKRIYDMKWLLMTDMMVIATQEGVYEALPGKPYALPPARFYDEEYSKWAVEGEPGGEKNIVRQDVLNRGLDFWLNPRGDERLAMIKYRKKARVNFVWYYFNPRKIWRTFEPEPGPYSAGRLSVKHQDWNNLKQWLSTMCIGHCSAPILGYPNRWEYFEQEYRQIKEMERERELADLNLNIRLKTVSKEWKRVVEKFEENQREKTPPL